MNSNPVELARALPRSAHFPAAAVATVGAMLETVAEAVAQSRFAAAEVKRGMLHLRPGDGYAGLFVLEHGGDALSSPGSRASLLPSASAWSALSTHRQPVALDVNLRILAPRGGRPEAASWGDDELSERSRVRLLDRDATHVYALPLYAADGELFGMISLEVACPKAIGDPFVWEDCGDTLEVLAGLAGPYLAALPHEPSQEPAPPAETDPLLPVVGPTMQGVVEVLRAFAAEEETLLIKGETGTGKSRIARWCHAHSGRSDGPFELLDLLSVPEETQAGELFGWKRGAFTGAVKDHEGYVARARGGTLFLDEIDKLSAKAQASLLYLLEERRYRVLGDEGQPREADVRFIVGTNVDLMGAVREGRFREDLYYRINVLPTRLPPLRERRDEIATWAAFMLERRHEEKSLDGTVRLAPEAATTLETGDWPGNLRELDNVMRRAHTLAMARGAASSSLVVDQGHLDAAWGMEGRTAMPPAAPLVAPTMSADARPNRRLEDLDEEEVLAALAATGYRRAKAAKRLGISRSSLYSYLAKSNLIPRPSELSRDAIVAAQNTHEGDLAAMAAALRVSEHGLKLRMSELGLER